MHGLVFRPSKYSMKSKLFSNSEHSLPVICFSEDQARSYKCNWKKSLTFSDSHPENFYFTPFTFLIYFEKMSRPILIFFIFVRCFINLSKFSFFLTILLKFGFLTQVLKLLMFIMSCRISWKSFLLLDKSSVSSSQIYDPKMIFFYLIAQQVSDLRY